MQAATANIVTTGTGAKKKKVHKNKHEKKEEEKVFKPNMC